MAVKAIRRYASYDEEAFRTLKASLDLPDILVKLLCMRGFTTPGEAVRYFEADMEDMHDPFLMKGMDRAVDRLKEAIAAGEAITIYGDYDVDGITSTSALYLFLKEAGAKVAYYIPDRLEEGYGINSDALVRLKELGAKVVVSVDTGITAVAQAQLAKELGLDLIITDHHECQEQIPEAYAVLNPKQPGCPYPFDMLSGAGVAFKLIQGLASRLDAGGSIAKYLEIIAIGTIADIVPMQGENRIIAKTAFPGMMDSWNKGIRALVDVSGIGSGKMSAGMIGFRIGPRLNAAGRLGDAKRAVALFLSEDPEETAAIASLLDEENARRQAMEKQIFEEAAALIEEDPAYGREKVLVVSSASWHHGVIGIVASRLVERYYKPVILLADEEGTASGSARSVEGFNLFEALTAVKHHFDKFGGHEMAAGMSLPSEAVESLRRDINLYAEDHMPEEALVPKLHVDLKLQMEEATMALAGELARMEPFGPGNPEPVFELIGRPAMATAIGKDGSHLRFKLVAGDLAIGCIAFGKGDMAGELALAESVSVAGTLGINEWQGRKSLQLVARDIAPADGGIEELETAVALASAFRSQGLLEGIDGSLLPDRSHFEKLYKLLFGLGRKQQKSISHQALARQLGAGTGQELLAYLLCLPVFEELELVSADLGRESLAFELHLGKKVDLAGSRRYNRLVEAKASIQGGKLWI